MNATAPAPDLAAAIAAALDPAAIAAAIAGTPAQEAAPAFALVSPEPPKPRAPRVDAWTADHAAELSAAIRSGSLARQLAQTNAAPPCAFQLELFAPAGQMNIFTDTIPAPTPEHTTPPDEPKPERRAPETKPEPQPAEPDEPQPQQAEPTAPENLTGRVVVSHFHYTQTHYSFYGVIRDTGKSLTLIRLAEEETPCGGFMQAHVRPIPDARSPFGYRIKDGARPITRRPDKSGYGLISTACKNDFCQVRTCNKRGYKTEPDIYDPARTYTNDYAD